MLGPADIYCVDMKKRVTFLKTTSFESHKSVFEQHGKTFVFFFSVNCAFNFVVYVQVSIVFCRSLQSDNRELVAIQTAWGLKDPTDQKNIQAHQQKWLDQSSNDY